jgi:Zinc carboxypeptidase/Cytosolic carboxypeptidase N-terminal domain
MSSISRSSSSASTAHGWFEDYTHTANAVRAWLKAQSESKTSSHDDDAATATATATAAPPRVFLSLIKQHICVQSESKATRSVSIPSGYANLDDDTTSVVSEAPSSTSTTASQTAASSAVSSMTSESGPGPRSTASSASASASASSVSSKPKLRTTKRGSKKKRGGKKRTSGRTSHTTKTRTSSTFVPFTSTLAKDITHVIGFLTKIALPQAIECTASASSVAPLMESLYLVATWNKKMALKMYGSDGIVVVECIAEQYVDNTAIVTAALQTWLCMLSEAGESAYDSIRKHNGLQILRNVISQHHDHTKLPRIALDIVGTVLFRNAANKQAVAEIASLVSYAVQFISPDYSPGLCSSAWIAVYRLVPNAQAASLVIHAGVVSTINRVLLSKSKALSVKRVNAILRTLVGIVGIKVSPTDTSLVMSQMDKLKLLPLVTAAALPHVSKKLTKSLLSKLTWHCHCRAYHTFLSQASPMYRAFDSATVDERMTTALATRHLQQYSNATCHEHFQLPGHHEDAEDAYSSDDDENHNVDEDDDDENQDDELNTISTTEVTTANDSKHEHGLPSTESFKWERSFADVSDTLDFEYLSPELWTTEQAAQGPLFDRLQSERKLLSEEHVQPVVMRAPVIDEKNGLPIMRDAQGKPANVPCPFEPLSTVSPIDNLNSLEAEANAFSYERIARAHIVYERSGLHDVCEELQKPLVSIEHYKLPVLDFESRHQCGNLHRAIRVGDAEYDLLLGADLNTRFKAHTQWYFYRVQGMQPNTPYKFNIVNLEKLSSAYNKGMKPVMYSHKLYESSGVGWHRVAHVEHISYYRNLRMRPHAIAASGTTTGTAATAATAADADVDDDDDASTNQEPIKYDACYTFTMTFSIPEEQDSIFLAYFFPFSYTFLRETLCHLEQQSMADTCLRRQVLTYTKSGNVCELLTITDLTSPKDEIVSRPVVVLSARVHPGEANSSWVMKGTLDFLLSDTPQAHWLRQHVVFKVIPMLNPDGVANGNHRCSLEGIDLNRHYQCPHPKNQPTVYSLKRIMFHLAAHRNLLLYCDFHGHSIINNFEMYGTDPSLAKVDRWSAAECITNKCGKANPAVPFSSTSPLWKHGIERLFPVLLQQHARSYLRYSDCKFGANPSKVGSARVAMWQQLRLPMCYTFEASFCGTNFGSLENMHLNTAHYEHVGALLAETIHDLVDTDNADGLAAAAAIIKKSRK